jgi:hypothetical protein
MLQELGTSYLNHQHQGREASCPIGRRSMNLNLRQIHRMRAHLRQLLHLHLQVLSDVKLLIEGLNVLLVRGVA